MVQNPIRFLCDENIRADVVEFLGSRGHTTILSREVLATSAPDQLIMLLGSYESLVIITHDKDFKKFRKLVPQNERNRFSSGAGRLLLSVPNDRALQRVAEEIESIEHHYGQAVKRRKPFDMIIQKATLRIRSL